MDARNERLNVLLALGSCVLLLGAAVAGLLGVLEFLAYFGPLLMFVLPLLAGRYVGEESITRLARRDRPMRRTRSAPATQRGIPNRPLVPRGGLLIATALAVRPPPASA